MASTNSNSTPIPTSDTSQIPEEHRLLVKTDAVYNKKTGKTTFTPMYADKRNSLPPSNDEISGRHPNGLSATFRPSAGAKEPPSDEGLSTAPARGVVVRDGKLMVVIKGKKMVLGPVGPLPLSMIEEDMSALQISEKPAYGEFAKGSGGKSKKSLTHKPNKPEEDTSKAPSAGKPRQFSKVTPKKTPEVNSKQSSAEKSGQSSKVTSKKTPEVKSKQSSDGKPKGPPKPSKNVPGRK